MAYFKTLLAAKKALRVFANKLRLHKLHRSKTTSRKLKKRPTIATRSTGTTKAGNWLSLPFQTRFKRRRTDVHRYPRKKTKPVYVDQLFLEQKQPKVPARISENVVEATSSKRGGAADDMWESMVLASPQLDAINERAEEFIARFRADLLVQEIMARRL